MIERRERPSNVTGLSLVLFMFLSLLSMMAAYETSKSVDESRISLVAALNECASHVADTDSDDHTFVVESPHVQYLDCAFFRLTPTTIVLSPHRSGRTFNARAPPLPNRAS